MIGRDLYDHLMSMKIPTIPMINKIFIKLRGNLAMGAIGFDNHLTLTTVVVCFISYEKVSAEKKDPNNTQLINNPN